LVPGRPLFPQADPGGGASTQDTFLFYLDEATKSLDKGDLVRAYRNVDFAARYATDQERHSQYDQVLRKVSAQADKVLDDANAKYAAGKYPEALGAYRVLVGMSNLPAAAEAWKKLREAERDPAMASALREPKAAMMYDQVDLLLGGWTSKGDLKAAASDVTPPAAAGAGADAVDDYGLAQRLGVEDRIKLTTLLRSIAKFSDTPTGQKADKLLQQLLDDPAFAAAFNAKQADDAVREDYKMAGLYAQNRMPEKARELFRKVIDNSPDSEWAQKARKDLESLDAPNP
jgi:tetratricopeptide (TPR) repeat protein